MIIYHTLNIWAKQKNCIFMFSTEEYLVSKLQRIDQEF